MRLTLTPIEPTGREIASVDDVVGLRSVKTTAVSGEERIRGIAARSDRGLLLPRRNRGPYHIDGHWALADAGCTSALGPGGCESGLIAAGSRGAVTNAMSRARGRHQARQQVLLTKLSQHKSRQTGHRNC